MVQRSPSHFQTGTFYWAHVRYPTSLGPELLIQRITPSMRSYVLSIKRLRSWGVSISALEGSP